MTHARLYIGLTLLACVAFGCVFPLPIPTVRRVDAKMDPQINKAWSRLLATPDRADRVLLLDAIVLGQMHEIGVDSVEFTSEKRVPGGTVQMEVHFQREHPEIDGFCFTQFDSEQNVLRRERYSLDEVHEQTEFLIGQFSAGIFGSRDRRTAAPRDSARRARIAEVESLLLPDGLTRSSIAPERDASSNAATASETASPSVN